MARTRRLALLALFTLAGCGDNGFQVDRLTPPQVAGSYSVCQLRFSPQNTLFPVANLLTSVMDTTPPAGRPKPSIALSASVQQFDLVYTRRADGFLQQLRGGTGLGESTVTARFYEENPGSVAAESLLPGSVAFTFQSSPRQLTATTGFYTVRRADYAAAAGVSEAGLQDRISGRLEAALQVDGCP